MSDLVSEALATVKQIDENEHVELTISEKLLVAQTKAIIAIAQAATAPRFFG
jgi:hypothetical protein